MPSKLVSKLKRAGAKVPQTGKRRSEPLWKGPEVDGVTFSMLSRFLVCRERFRLYAIEGFRTADVFNHRIEYGQMWHACEEALAARKPWLPSLQKYAQGLCQKYRTAQEHVDTWYRICKDQFPLYVEHWRRHPDVIERTPIFQEQVFEIPYTLPSGRTVRLRGKFDSVDSIGEKNPGIYLQENKTKGDIYEPTMRRQLSFDLQTMMYLVALGSLKENTKDARSFGAILKAPIRGVRYNVVRRPLSGGKGTIKRHEPSKKNPAGETKEQYHERLRGIMVEDPGYYFMRWQVEIVEGDIERFKRECLDPILQNLCEWYDWIVDCKGSTEFSTFHWRHPFGVYNVLDEGGSSDWDEYLATGTEIGLRRVDELFTELKPCQ